MEVNTIFVFALSAAFITSWSRIDPPGWTIILTPAAINDFIPSANGKKASEAAIEFLILLDWKSLAFCTAILQLSRRLGCPAPIPIVEKLFVNTIAFDLTYFEILNANSISFNSFAVGLFFVTNFKSFLLKIDLSLSCNKKKPLNFFIVVWFFCLYFEILMILKFFFLFKILRASFSKPLARIT